ncbi:MAG: Crp/Fnr family transcriptional regulator [Flavobacterium sp.]|uniref:Crp/Fnr family transcriptional regulator n=1 Tax=Flavobacterium sp. TaxID=239 RepID=UPI0032649CF6
MNTDFFNYIYNHPLISGNDLKQIAEAHQKVQFIKGDIILECGKIANEYYLIENGLVRVFVYDYNGNEITTDFHGDSEVLIEVSSLFQRVPTKEIMVAITDVTAWKIDFETFQELFHKIEGFREWGRSWMSQQLFIAKERAVIMHTKSASERYIILTNEKPEIIQKAPIKYIASYLGITDTSLSRIRKEILKN